MWEVIKNNEWIYESTLENLKEIDATKVQMTETLKALNLNAENSFYKVDIANNKIIYDMNAVKAYLESIKDKSWGDLVKTNSRTVILAVQIALEVLGKDVGTIDGVLWTYGKDSQTKKAIRAFQSENWLTPNWAPGKDTLNVLVWKLSDELNKSTINSSINKPSNAPSNLSSKTPKTNPEVNNYKIPEDLKNYREKWKENVKGISETTKEKIIKAAETIPLKVEKDSDWSNLIELKLWRKNKRIYKILDPKLEKHTDDKYKASSHHPHYFPEQYITWNEKCEVLASWMLSTDVEKWENNKLKEYVKEKQKDGLYIPDYREMDKLLRDLWKKVFGHGWDSNHDKIAALMYLTWMEGDYWLDDMSWISRSYLGCRDGSNGTLVNTCNRDFYSSYIFDISASLCMIARN